tara:strand:+ start:1826 stop:2197 length:372 start_codon:yes stop_codon:yes gene_type:complete
MAAKQVWLGSDDEILITILDKNKVDSENPQGTPIPFIDNGVSSMKLFRDDNDAVIANSADNDGKLSYDNAGNITIALGSVESTAIAKDRSYETYIKAYSVTKPNGQTIVHHKRSDSNLSVTFN